MFCRNCGREIGEGNNVCTSCGVPSGNGYHFCPRCGHPTDELAIYCTNCGSPLTNRQGGTACRTGGDCQHKPRCRGAVGHFSWRAGRAQFLPWLQRKGHLAGHPVCALLRRTQFNLGLCRGDFDFDGQNLHRCRRQPVE